MVTKNQEETQLNPNMSRLRWPRAASQEFLDVANGILEKPRNPEFTFIPGELRFVRVLNGMADDGVAPMQNVENLSDLLAEARSLALVDIHTEREAPASGPMGDWILSLRDADDFRRKMSVCGVEKACDVEALRGPTAVKNEAGQHVFIPIEGGWVKITGDAAKALCDLPYINQVF